MARFWQRIRDRLTSPTQYIQVTDSVSRPTAVMLKLIMLFVLIAAIISIFFAGRWGYDQITTKSSKPANPVTGISTAINTDSKHKANDTPHTSGSTATPTPPSATAVAPTTPSANRTAASATDTGMVPNTGTGGTLGVFIVSSVIGSLFYREYILRRLK